MGAVNSTSSSVSVPVQEVEQLVGSVKPKWQKTMVGRGSKPKRPRPVGFRVSKKRRVEICSSSSTRRGNEKEAGQANFNSLEQDGAQENEAPVVSNGSDRSGFAEASGLDRQFLLSKNSATGSLSFGDSFPLRFHDTSLPASDYGSMYSIYSPFLPPSTMSSSPVSLPGCFASLSSERGLSGSPLSRSLLPSLFSPPVCSQVFPSVSLAGRWPGSDLGVSRGVSVFSNQFGVDTVGKDSEVPGFGLGVPVGSCAMCEAEVSRAIESAAESVEHFALQVFRKDAEIAELQRQVLHLQGFAVSARQKDREILDLRNHLYGYQTRNLLLLKQRAVLLQHLVGPSKNKS
mmetsp:Transcript_4154/g.6464  ORF Transcript_4154/g.6464 Transcript_4154/m.6464 type:complete len:345 (+) Transcript_4154:113-1147(+)